MTSECLLSGLLPPCLSGVRYSLLLQHLGIFSRLSDFFFQLETSKLLLTSIATPTPLFKTGIPRPNADEGVLLWDSPPSLGEMRGLGSLQLAVSQFGTVPLASSMYCGFSSFSSTFVDEGNRKTPSPKLWRPQQ
jgi:hypothetical protein